MAVKSNPGTTETVLGVSRLTQLDDGSLSVDTCRMAHWHRMAHMKETPMNSLKQSVSGSISNVMRTMIMQVDKGKDVTYLILKEESRVTTSVAPIHFLVLVSLPPSCSHPCKQHKHSPISYHYSPLISKERERDFYRLVECNTWRSKPLRQACSINFCIWEMEGIMLGSEKRRW